MTDILTLIITMILMMMIINSWIVGGLVERQHYSVTLPQKPCHAFPCFRFALLNMIIIIIFVIIIINIIIIINHIMSSIQSLNCNFHRHHSDTLHCNHHQPAKFCRMLSLYSYNFVQVFFSQIFTLIEILSVDQTLLLKLKHSFHVSRQIVCPKGCIVKFDFPPLSVFSNVSSNCLTVRMQSHTGCICLAFLHRVFSNFYPFI